MYLRSFLWNLINNWFLQRQSGSSRDCQRKGNLHTSSITEHHGNSTDASNLRPQFEKLPLEVISSDNRNTVIQNIEFALVTRTTAKPLIEVQTDLAGNKPSTQTDKDSIFFISARTAAQAILNTTTSSLNIIIIDCRFPYEYEGGHIRNAYNCYIPKQVSQYPKRSLFIKIHKFQDRRPSLSSWMGDSTCGGRHHILLRVFISSCSKNVTEFKKS
ncbi:uncharacterized protein Gasu_07360 [Galdieria sulphuraria]|uniref:Rhodanese domain-containing protein n=1 Tax=Galdieria sulphuraria TaxID=130081 RepID=M2Y831_GALSU|nr:uncharacterized protein Gasu_07360 [Galdieria sulphuraria]EME31989.1 hypothetical protein Gasu_07360 [Galdieria sulphuraria]|eukprot:XP_005708509.1 hypothetical protein Gasu_07360 [Galdieria sulphuraria]